MDSHEQSAASQLVSKVLSDEELSALVSDYVSTDVAAFKKYAQALDPTLTENSDYSSLSFSVGASYTVAGEFASLATLQPDLPTALGKSIAGFKLYHGMGKATAGTKLIASSIESLQDGSLSDSGKAAAAFDIMYGLKSEVMAGLTLLPYASGQSAYNKLSYEQTSALIDKINQFKSEFVLSTSDRFELDKHITAMGNNPISLTPNQQAKFDKLKATHNELEDLEAELTKRIEKINQQQDIIAKSTEFNVFDRYDKTTVYTDSIAANKSISEALSGQATQEFSGERIRYNKDASTEAGKFVITNSNGIHTTIEGEFISIRGDTVVYKKSDSISELRDKIAAKTQALDVDFREYTSTVGEFKTHTNFIQLVEADGTYLTLTSKSGKKISNLDFSSLDADFSIDSDIKINKPGASSDAAGIAGGVGSIIGGVAFTISSAIGLEKVLSSGKASDAEKAVASLMVVSASLEAISGVLDVLSGLAKFAKFSKALGVAGAIVGAVADLAFGAATVVKTFNDPNATDLQKGLSIANLLTPGFDLLAIEKAEHYRNMLDDSNLSEADKFAFEALYKQAIFNSIPIFNAFSFAWGDNYLATEVAGDLIENYGDVVGDPNVLDDGDIFAFLQNSYQKIAEDFFESKKPELISNIQDLGPQAQQIVLAGKTANYSMLTSNAEAKKIYDKIVPEAIRDDADQIYKYTVTIVDGVTQTELDNSNQTAARTSETTTAGAAIWRESGADWRLGMTNNQPDSIKANTAIVAIGADYAGDAYLYDDLGIDNTVIYQSTGDRKYGFVYEGRTVTETKYKEITGTTVIGKAGVATTTETVAYQEDVWRLFRKYIDGPGAAKPNVDHINIGQGRDNVIAGHVDELLRITSGDWQDFRSVSSVSGDGAADLDRLTITDSTLKRFEIGNPSETISSSDLPSAAGDRRVDLTWRTEGKSTDSVATIEDVEMVVLAKDDTSRAILYSEEGEGFTLAMTGGGRLPLYLSDAPDAKSYKTGSIIGSDQADYVEINNSFRVETFSADLKGGNDLLRIDSPGRGFYSIVGGEGFDELQIDSFNGRKTAIFLGDNAGSHLQSYMKGLNKAVENGEAAAADADLVGISAAGVEKIQIDSDAAAYFQIGGGANQVIFGTAYADVYAVNLDNSKTTDITIEDSTGPLDYVNIDLTDVSDFRLEQEYSGNRDTDTRTIRSEGAQESSVELTSDAIVSLGIGGLTEFTYARNNIFGERVAAEGQSLPSSDLAESQVGSVGDDLFIVHGDGDPNLVEMTIKGSMGSDRVLLTGVYDIDSLTSISYDGQAGPTSNNVLSFSGTTDIRDYHNTVEKYYFLNDQFELDRNLIDGLVKDGNGGTQRDLIVLTSPGDYVGNGGADVYFVGPNSGGNTEFRIKDFSADDTLFFSAQISFASLKPMKVGNDLVITSEFATDLSRTIVIEGYFNAAARQGKIQSGEVEFTKEMINLSINLARLQAKSDQDSGVAADGEADVDGVFSALFNQDVTLEGSNASEEINGTRGADSINGGAETDTIHGGAGNDTIQAGSNREGGSGYDILSFDMLTGSQNVDLNGEQSVQETPAGTSTANVINNISGFEGVIGGLGDDTITGNNNANIISGGRGSDYISGGGGDDIILPGALPGRSTGRDYETDTLDGGTGFDIVSFEGESGEQIEIDLGAKPEGWSYARAYTYQQSSTVKETISYIKLRNFEGVVGGQLDDEISGDDVANYLSGIGGNDRLSGRAGSDTLVGGAGNDTLIGGEGNDALVGGDGADTFIIGGSNEAGTLDTIYDFNAAEDTLDISGTAFTVTMEADQFVFDPVSKTQSFFKSSAIIGNGESSVLLHGVTVEEARQILSGKATVVVEASDNGSKKTGNAVSNFIDGSDGDDYILGMGGDDTIKASSGVDTLDGGEGFDYLDFSGSEFGIQHKIGTESFDVLRDNRFVNEGDVVRNFEGVIGSGYSDNFLTYTSDAAYLVGLGGDDRLIGNIGDDTIWGGSGDDNIQGRQGNDVLIGGTGQDTFSFFGGEDGVDAITDFDTTEDYMFLLYTGARSFADLSITDTRNGVLVEWDTDSTGLTKAGVVLQGLVSSQISAESFLFL
ncbi:Ca2+-binding protein, RTX toxin-related [Aliiroseovarius crassostreae]|nr:Ca2+-binding protein, RTX toxin-related [Aliiroseovarius crassostreae]